MDVPAVVAGTIESVLVKVGDKVSEGSSLAIIDVRRQAAPEIGTERCGAGLEKGHPGRARRRHAGKARPTGDGIIASRRRGRFLQGSRKPIRAQTCT